MSSLPPQISLDTRDIFIECTATDLTKAKVVLNTVCCMFAEYCERPFEVEPVRVVDAFGKATREWLGGGGGGGGREEQPIREVGEILTTRPPVVHPPLSLNG